MNSRQTPVTLPLDYATEIAVEMHLMRAECSDAARVLLSHSETNDAALEECAQLDDALARAQAILQSAVKNIRYSRSD